MDASGIIDKPDDAIDLDALASRILVAVPVLNEAATIEDCLRSLLTGLPALSKIACIVADGGSEDGTRDVVDTLRGEFPNLSLIDNPGRLQSAGINAVASEGDVSRDILVRCDAHALYPENFVLDVAVALERSGADSLVVPMDATGSSCFQKANAWIVDTPLGSGGSAHRGGKVSGWVDHGHHAAFRLDKFRQISGYDETFSHNEDAEFDARLRRAGGRIWLDASIRVTYLPRATIPGLCRQYFLYGRGRARNILKNRELPRPRQMAPVINLLLLTVCLCAAPAKPAVLLWPAAYAILIVLTSLGVTVLKRSFCGLWAGIAMAAMHLSWGAGFLFQLPFGARGRAR